MRFSKHKILPLFFLLLSILCTDSALAGYRQKVSVELFNNPAGWNESYNPGVILSDILTESLTEMNQYQIVNIPGADKKRGKSFSDQMDTPEGNSEEPILQNFSDKQKDMRRLLSPVSRINNMSHPAQFLIKGKILSLNTSSRLSGGDIKGLVPKSVEKVEISVEIKIVKYHTGRIVERRIFALFSEDGLEPFIQGTDIQEQQTPSFYKTSLGQAMKKMNREILDFIGTSIEKFPLEGEIVFIDEPKGEVTINLGSENGVRVQDEFVMYWVTLKYSDPLSQTDMGDQLTRLGVIKVSEVHARYSRAAVTAGYGISQGDLVRSQKTALSLSAK